MRSKQNRAARVCTEYWGFTLLFLLIMLGMSALFFYLSGHAPASSDQHYAPSRTVILDAGHGGEDGGAVGLLDGREILEKDLNLTITLLLRDMLEVEGIPVILTREEDVLLYDRNTDYQGRKKALDLAARLHVGQSTPDALFVSIHMNAFTQAQYRGLQVYYSPNHALSPTLAENIQSLTAQQLQQDNDRKIKQADSGIFLLERLSCPAVLVECGFLSNPHDCRLLCEEEYQQKIAFVLFCAIKETLAEEKSKQEDPVWWTKIEVLLPGDLIFDPKCIIIL